MRRTTTTTATCATTRCARGSRAVLCRRALRAGQLVASHAFKVDEIRTVRVFRLSLLRGAPPHPRERAFSRELLPPLVNGEKYILTTTYVLIAVPSV